MLHGAVYCTYTAVGLCVCVCECLWDDTSTGYMCVCCVWCVGMWGDGWLQVYVLVCVQTMSG